jgi:agmatinase
MAPLTLLSLSYILGTLTDARKITFPPVSGYSSQQIIPQGFNELDITHDKFAGLTTYGHLPYVHCLAPEGHHVEPFDVAILGAPFDTVRTLHAYRAATIGSW